MNLLENLKKPWVLYAGIGIGLIFLVTKSGGSSQPNVKVAADYQAAMNLAGMNYMQHLYDEAVTYAIAQTNADVQTRALVAGTMLSLSETSTVHNTNLANINAGITNSLIAASTALKLDRQQNDSRALLYGLVSSQMLDNLDGKVTPQIAEQNP